MVLIDIRPSDDGLNIQLNVTEPPQQTEITAKISAKDAGHFVTGILTMSVDCAKKTGEFAKLNLKEADQKKLQYVLAHEFAVADAIEAADAVVLVFAIGATELSIGIQKDALAELGHFPINLVHTLSWRRSLHILLEGRARWPRRWQPTGHRRCGRRPF